MPADGTKHKKAKSKKQKAKTRASVETKILIVRSLAAGHEMFVAIDTNVINMTNEQA